MTVAVSNTNLNDSFNTWRLNTNLAATVLSNNVVTVTRAGSASRGGVALGNAHIQGSLSATNIRTSTLKGGNNSSGTGGALTVASNTTFTGTTTTFAANAVFQGNVDFSTAGTDRINLGNITRLIISGGSAGQFIRTSGSGDNPAYKSLTLRDITDLSSNAASIILSAANTTFSDNGDTPHLVFAANNGTDKVEIYLASNSSAATDSDLIVQLAGTGANASLSIVNSSNTEVASIRADGTIFATANVTATGIATDGHILPIGDDARDLGAPNREFRNLYIDGVANIDELSVATGASQGVSTSLIPKTDAVGNLGSTTRKWGTVWADNTNGGAGVFNTLGVSGTFTANGNMTLGNATADTITVKGTFANQSTSGRALFGGPVAVGKTSGGVLRLPETGYALTANASVYVGENLQVQGNTNVVGNLTVDGSTTISSGQAFIADAGQFTNLTVNGNTVIGSGSTKTIQFLARANTGLSPNSTDAYSLGASGLRWSHVYGVVGDFSSKLTGLNVVSTANTTVGKKLSVTQSAVVSKNLTVSGNTDISGKLSNDGTTVIGANAKLHANNTITAKTITTTMIANTMTSGGNFGSATQIPIINVNDRGQVTGISETTVDVVTGLTYSSANNNIRISTADGSTFDDVIDPATTSVRGVASFDSGDFDVSSGAVSLKNATSGAVLAISATANETTVSRSNGTVTVGLPDDVTITGQLNVGENVVVSGNLTVSGTTTTVNTETVNIADNIIVLNSNHSGPPTQDAGISIERGSSADKTLIWDETLDRWTVGSETFVAGTFIGALTGNASTATALATGRTIALSGDVTATGVSFDGTGNISLSTTIQPNSVALGTDTTGNYVGTITAGDGIDTSGASSGEGIAHSISLEKASTSNLGGAIFNSNNFVVDSNGLASIKPSGIQLGTETSGNYVAAVSASGGIDVSGSGSEGATVTIGVESDLRGDVVYIGQDTNDYYFVNTNAHDWYLDGVLDMRLENDGDLHVDGDLVSHSSTTSSDEKLKTDITVVEDAVSKVEQLRGVEFTWKKDGSRSAGVIAQDVEKVLPQAVKIVEDLNTMEEYRTVKYDSLHALLIEAVKELSARVKELESK